MGRHKSDFAQKVAWMVDHQKLWQGWPEGKLDDEAIIDRMRVDGLVSPKVSKYGIGDFGKLVMEARAILRKKQK